METIADYFSQKDRIKQLETKVRTENAIKNKAIKTRDNQKAQITRTVDIIIKLCKAGKCTLTNQEIADACFVSLKTVVNCRGRLKRAELNEKRANIINY